MKLQKRLIFQVYVSHRSKLYDVCTKSVKQYATSIGVDYHCQTTPILKVKPDLFQSNRSRESWEKYGGYIPIFEKENFIHISNISILKNEKKKESNKQK